MLQPARVVVLGRGVTLKAEEVRLEHYESFGHPDKSVSGFIRY